MMQVESTTNKLRVNGRVVEEAELADGDTIQVSRLEGRNRQIPWKGWFSFFPIALPAGSLIG